MAFALAGSAVAQTVPDASVPETGLNIPSNVQIFGKLDPNVRKATAIVNGTVITGTDIDQRTALTAAFNQYSLDQLTPEQRDQLRLTVLRNLIDEVLKIQQAKTEDITISQDEMNQALARIARNMQKDPKQLGAWLRQVGSSERSMRRQIEGELAWQRYLRRRVEPLINVGDEEVQAIVDRLKKAQGTEEYHLREIYINASPDTAQSVFDSMRQMMQEMQSGKAPFDYYARAYSVSTTKSTGGDLGWVRADALPPELAKAAAEMHVGQLAGPIEISGAGFSVLYMVDKRKVLTADPRDSRLSLKQLTISFPAGTTQAQAQVRASEFAKTVEAINGCGDVNRVAASIGAQVTDNDQLTIRDLPGPLQDILLKMQIGQATPPFGSPEEGVRTLVLCDRAEPANGGLPSNAQIQSQIEESRVNLRSEQMLRDLRRDAIIEYR